ncbi:signal recognition particle 19 kDa protein isoform X2 [Sitodiplosis mosellana]|uniref:signal recognition particle 19 kDa protein isoform X2 n=1 Tax=Sitodiplosis mosellana TaxID=263140 RepID=UPI002444A624|nr:signal recognition particle 19 kDa protein isoform X2 [Sitodiplosis mosellana]
MSCINIILQNYIDMASHSVERRKKLHLLLSTLYITLLRLWICIYPAYINSKKSRKEGRKIQKDFCVENPTYQEIKDVLSVSNLRIGIENKQYPREKSKELHHRGRIRVQLKTDDGSPFNPDFTTRESILLHLGCKIPLLKVRQSGGHTNDHTTHNQSHQTNYAKKGKGKKR